MRILKIVLKVIKWIVLALLLFLLACNIYVLIRRAAFGDKMPRVFGFASAVVVSPSMEPTIKVNDMVIVHTRKEYREKDVVMYLDSYGDYTTHRIVGETENGFILQGDNNDSPDSAPVAKDKIVGAVVLTIPKAGKLSNFISSPWGALTIAVVGMAIIFLPDVISSLVRKSKKGESEEKEE